VRIARLNNRSEGIKLPRRRQFASARNADGPNSCVMSENAVAAWPSFYSDFTGRRGEYQVTMRRAGCSAEKERYSSRLYFRTCKYVRFPCELLPRLFQGEIQRAEIKYKYCLHRRWIRNDGDFIISGLKLQRRKFRERLNKITKGKGEKTEDHHGTILQNIDIR